MEFMLSVGSFIVSVLSTLLSHYLLMIVILTIQIAILLPILVIVKIFYKPIKNFIRRRRARKKIN